VGEWALAVFLLAALALIASIVDALRFAASRWAAAALGLFAAYTAWTIASLLWSPNRGDAWIGAGLTLLYLLAFWLVVGLVPLGKSRHWVLAASALGPAVVAASTLPRLVPRMDPLFDSLEGDFGGRLRGTVNYYNGEAAFLLVPFWVAVYLGGSPRVHPLLRGAVLAGAVLSADVAVLAQSRGAMVAMAASLPVFFLLSGQRLRGLFALAPIALALLAAFPNLNEVYLAVPDHERARVAIERALPTVWLTAAGAGLYGLLWGLVDGRWRPPRSLTRTVGGIALVGTLAALVLGAAAFTERAGNPVEWGQQKWEAFKTDDRTGEDQGRYLSAGGMGRYTYWQVAWEDFASHPLLGVGTHNYEATFYRLRERSAGFTRQPHSLPLEVLAERGVVGGVLFFGFLGVCVGAGLRRRFGSLDSDGKAQVGAMVAAVAYWFVHSGVEWFWQVPAVTLPAVVYLAMLVGAWERAENASPRWPLRAVGAGVAVLAVAAVTPLYVADRYLTQSYVAQALGGGLPAVERAQLFNPASSELRLREAELAARSGDWDRAEEAYRDAIRLNPDHFLPHALLAQLYVARGDPTAALSSYLEALARNPFDEEVGLNRGAIDVLARAEVTTTPVRFTSEGTELGRLTLTVANDTRERAVQRSTTLPSDTSVLLVWPADTTDPLRMEGVLDPVDLAFVDADGYVTEIESVDRTDEEVRSQQPYRMVVEANRGFFEDHGILPGSRAVFATFP
jgi:uncharacterized membrane protein (UPF0127 family)